MSTSPLPYYLTNLLGFLKWIECLGRCGEPHPIDWHLCDARKDHKEEIDGYWLTVFPWQRLVNIENYVKNIYYDQKIYRWRRRKSYKKKFQWNLQNTLFNISSPKYLLPLCVLNKTRKPGYAGPKFQSPYPHINFL